MGDLSRGERLQIMLTPEELRIIDTWRFSKRMPSRAAAIRELLKRGLAVEGFGEVRDGQKSKDFFRCFGESGRVARWLEFEVGAADRSGRAGFIEKSRVAHWADTMPHGAERGGGGR